MYSASKIGSLVKKLGFNKSKQQSLCSNYNLLAVAEAKHGDGVHARRGYVAMYVGEEGKRYEVPLKFLSSPMLQQLILHSQDEDLEPKIDGPITIVDCTAESFDQILKLLKHHHHHHA